MVRNRSGGRERCGRKYQKHNLLLQWHETVLHANDIDLTPSD